MLTEGIMADDRQDNWANDNDFVIADDTQILLIFVPQR